ncbi:MAG TPA: blue light sensor protein [Gammaproteobacteria bacterium]|nr:blue light sensor protein [Gammaproteobacteria bacterium]
MVSTPQEYDEPAETPEEPLLFNLVYASTVTNGVSSADVDDIINASHRHNTLVGITGILVLGSGVFFQWIEGPKKEVMSLVKLIETDRRHELMTVLSTDEEIRERIFPSWDMELVDADHIQEVLQDALETARDDRSAAALQLLLQKVSQNTNPTP